MYALLRRLMSPRPAAVCLTLWYVLLLSALILLADHAPTGDFRYGQL